MRFHMLGAAPGALLRWLPPVSLLGVLWATMPGFLPSNPESCASAPSLTPETGLRLALIEYKRFGEEPKLIRYSLPADVAGRRIPLPYIHIPWPQLMRVALVDSAGNQSCWSGWVVVLPPP